MKGDVIKMLFVMCLLIIASSVILVVDLLHKRLSASQICEISIVLLINILFLLAIFYQGDF